MNFIKPDIAFLASFIGICMSATTKWTNQLNHTAYGYLGGIGIREARRVYMEEDFKYLTPRIVGGDTADIVQFRYQAGLLVTIANLTGIGLCGGALVSKDRVATAAHCWYDGVYQGTHVTVVLGSSVVFFGGTRIQSREVHLHPEWNPALACNDVAVVYLPTAVAFSESIAPINLPLSVLASETFVGETVIASGFGRTGEDFPVTENQILSKVNLTVISNEECARTYLYIIRSSNICTSGRSSSGHVAICSGDSGGPLAAVINGESILIGLASFGSPLGCNSDQPNGYARVTSYASFFRKHILGFEDYDGSQAPR